MSSARPSVSQFDSLIGGLTGAAVVTASVTTAVTTGVANGPSLAQIEATVGVRELLQIEIFLIRSLESRYLSRSRYQTIRRY